MVEIREESAQLVIRIGGQEYTRYQFGAPHWKPYLYPIRAANGLSLVADEPNDHRHHHGIWIGHGRVNGDDFWLERPTSGRIVHVGFDHLESGGEQAAFTARNEWISAAGVTALTDTRTFTFYEQPSADRVFDLDLTLFAPAGQVVELHPTNEAGLPSIRVAEGITSKTGGKITNAEGGVNERGTYKKRSAWIDCSGRLGRQECGIAIFDHPRKSPLPDQLVHPRLRPDRAQLRLLSGRPHRHHAGDASAPALSVLHPYRRCRDRACRRGLGGVSRCGRAAQRRGARE